MATYGKGWDVPPEADSIGDFRWWKLGGNRVLKLVIVSHEAFYYKGHYVGKRMIPCSGDNCALCAKGIGGQLRFVFAAAELDTHQMGLIELGRSVGLEIRDLVARHGQLRGMPIELSRLSYSRNSRMEVEYVDREIGNWWYELAVPDAKKALEATWLRQGKEPDKPEDKAPDGRWGKHYVPPEPPL